MLLMIFLKDYWQIIILKIVNCINMIGFPLEKNTNIIGIPRSELKFYDYYLQWGDYKENKIKGLICSSIISKRDYLNDYHSGINTKKILIIQPHIEIQNKLFITKSYFLNFLKDFNNLLNNFDKLLNNNPTTLMI